jgi:hypothetical protein
MVTPPDLRILENELSVIGRYIPDAEAHEILVQHFLVDLIGSFKPLFFEIPVQYS